MRVAAVDIGTNTVRLLLADAVLDGGAVTLLETQRHEIVTKLGEGLDATGRLGDIPMARALAGLTRYAALVKAAGISVVGGVATAATRSASNGQAFVRRAAQALGFMPGVIDGTEEARLTFLGATYCLDGADTYCVIDVGGGSTEFVAGRRQPEYAVSVDIGSVRLTERAAALGLALPEEARSYLDGLFVEVTAPQATLVLGSGGTFVTLAAVARGLLPDEIVDGAAITLSMPEVVSVVDRLCAMTPEAIAAMPSVAAGRAEVLSAGVVCAERAAARVGAFTVRISVRDILDGIAIELATGRWPQGDRPA